MRIRKRFLSLSSVLRPPSPPSDPPAGDNHHQKPPHLLPLVQQKQVHPNGNLRDTTHPDPSDPPPHHHPLPSIGLVPSSWVVSGAGGELKEPRDFVPKEMEGKRIREVRETDVIKGNDTGRKEAGSTAINAGGTTSLPPPLTTAHLVMKGWLEGDILIPFKKRRGSCGKRANHEVQKGDSCIVKDEQVQEEKKERNIVDVEKAEVIQETGATSKKRMRMKNGKRSNVIMEGSRCSRVNGRGWRCCQQTLVGYSLCEHHLGKGRLRSMSSVRSRTRKVAPKQDKEKQLEKEEIDEKMMLLDHQDQELDYQEVDEDGKEEELRSISMLMKKKLGVVKARSISSLLGQTNS